MLEDTTAMALNWILLVGIVPILKIRYVITTLGKVDTVSNNGYLQTVTFVLSIHVLSTAQGKYCVLLSYIP